MSMSAGRCNSRPNIDVDAGARYNLMQLNSGQPVDCSGAGVLYKELSEEAKAIPTGRGRDADRLHEAPVKAGLGEGIPLTRNGMDPIPRGRKLHAGAVTASKTALQDRRIGAGRPSAAIDDPGAWSSGVGCKITAR